MRSLRYILLILSLSFMTNVFAYRGGDIIINNQSAYLLEISPYAPSEDFMDYAHYIESGKRGKLYVELWQDYSKRILNIGYEVICPNGSIDKIKIRVYNLTLEHGNVDVSRLGDGPHCINVDGNDNLEWRWNQLPGNPPEIVIHNQ